MNPQTHNALYIMLNIFTEEQLQQIAQALSNPVIKQTILNYLKQ